MGPVVCPPGSAAPTAMAGTVALGSVPGSAGRPGVASCTGVDEPCPDGIQRDGSAGSRTRRGAGFCVGDRGVAVGATSGAGPGWRLPGVAGGGAACVLAAGAGAGSGAQRCAGPDGGGLVGRLGVTGPATGVPSFSRAARHASRQSRDDGDGAAAGGGALQSR